MAIAIITVLYVLTTWLVVGHSGVDGVSAAANDQLGNLFFNLSDHYVGHWLTSVMAMLMIVAQFAVALAFTNATARYTHALSKERLLPHWLGAAGASVATPRAAVAFLLGVAAVLILVGGLLGLDPYIDLSSVFFGVGILGIVAIQALACLSVVVYFWRRDGFHWWKTLVAPAVGGLGLAIAVLLMWQSFSYVSGKDSAFVGALPLLLVAVAAAGVGYSLYLRSRHRRRYELLGAGDTTDEYDGFVSPDIWNAQDSPDDPGKP